MTPDTINGLFELAGAGFLWRSIILLYRQKQVRGVSFLTVGFFTVWGLWNLYFYPALQQWFSFYGGIAITISNLLWMSQMIYYIQKETV